MILILRAWQTSLKDPCLVLVIEWQPRWTNVFKYEIHRWLVHKYMCVSNTCHGGEIAWICCKAHTCDEGAHCIWDMTLSYVTKVEKIKTRLGLMDRLQVWRASRRLWSDRPRGGEAWAKTWRRWTKATVKSKWGQDRWTNKIMWWYEVDHIICDMVGACVASPLEEMEWNVQGKGITYRVFHFTGHRCVEKFMIRFRIDGHTIKRGKLVCILVI